MERADLVVRQSEGNKTLQKIEIQPAKEVSITDAAIGVQRNVYFYFLDKIQPLPPRLANFNAVLKDVLRKDYIDHSNIYKDLIIPFIIKWVGEQSFSLNGKLKLEMVGAQDHSSIYFQEIFGYGLGFGPDKLSITELREQINSLAEISIVDFNTKLSDYHIPFFARPAYISFKNNLVRAYQHYFKKVDEHLAYLQPIMPSFTNVDFDFCRSQIVEQIKLNPQEKQERSVLEMMRLYVLYPKYQQLILPTLLNQCKPQPIIHECAVSGESTTSKGAEIIKTSFRGTLLSFNRDNKTSPIQLSEVARKLKQEGLHPNYICVDPLLNGIPDEQSHAKGKEKVELDSETQLSIEEKKSNEAQQKSFDETIKMFLNAETILSEFTWLPESYEYDKIDEKESAVSKAEYILSNAETIEDYIAAFNLMAPYINRHKHYRWDSFFGNEITKSWNKLMKQIREPATIKLLTEVSQMADEDAKIKRLKEACEMPLFNQHRNNHWYTGAFGDTHAVSWFKKEIAKLEERKNRPKRYVLLSRSV